MNNKKGLFGCHRKDPSKHSICNATIPFRCDLCNSGHTENSPSIFWRVALGRVICSFCRGLEVNDG